MPSVNFEKQTITFIYNDLIGGVNSVIYNVLKFGDFSKFKTKVILIHNKGQKSISRVDKSIAENVIHFEYSKKENSYYIFKRLAGYINQEDIIIANDGLELGMISKLGMQNKTILIVHGNYDYYYNMAIMHKAAIDKFIAVSAYISDKLKEKLPGRTNDVLYIPNAAVSPLLKRRPNLLNPLKLLFVGRLNSGKGYFLLPQIDEKLLANRILVKWTIVSDIIEDYMSIFKKQNSEVEFTGKLDNSRLLEIIPDHDIFILPSLAEGFPISLIEAMKAGLVPLVTNLPSGIPEIVLNNKTGFLLNPEASGEYVELISKLHFDRNLLEEISYNAYSFTKEKFLPAETSEKYIELFKKLPTETYSVKPVVKLYESRLDNKNIPNWIVYPLRSLINLIRRN